MKPTNQRIAMLRACALAAALASPAAWAQHGGTDHSSMPDMDHGSMDHGSMNHEPANGAGAPPVGSLPVSDGAGERGYDSYGIHPHMMDDAPTWQALFDKFGYSHGNDGQNALQWDGRFWFGTATNRLLIRSEGEKENGGGSGGKVEALWSHAVSPYWDLQLGARRDIGSGPKYNWAAFGLEGALPYNIDLQATGYLGPSGRKALALKAEYDLLLTQRLILTPELQANLYSQDDPEAGIGSGLSDGSLSLRLRYEFTRQFAPYIGVSFARKFGQTASYATDAGASRSQTAVIAGVRFWF